MYLDYSSTIYIENIDPFFLSLIINGKTLKNCMIYLGASTTVIPFMIIEALGLKLDTKEGRCRAMDVREFLVIGTINYFPFKLVVYPDVDLTMIVLVVDIPPQYIMFISRKWSVAMGGIL